MQCQCGKKGSEEEKMKRKSRRASHVFNNYGENIDIIKLAIAFVKAFHVSHVSHQMGFSLPNPGLLEMHWIWHMNHCQLDV